MTNLHDTLNQLRQMRLCGFIAALQEQLENPTYRDLSFEERFSWIVDREFLARKNRQTASRLRQAALKHSEARIETLDFEKSRGIKKSEILELAQCSWIAQHGQLLVLGPTGVGKTFLACALAERAVALGFTARYDKLASILGELALCRSDGTYRKRLRALAKVDLLILDEWLLSPLNAQQARDALELIDERYLSRSTIFVSQLPVASWHAQIGDPTVADALLDRIVHQARRIVLMGESMRSKSLPAAFTEGASLRSD